MNGINARHLNNGNYDLIQHGSGLRGTYRADGTRIGGDLRVSRASALKAIEVAMRRGY